jgi:hypothetical protein
LCSHSNVRLRVLPHPSSVVDDNRADEKNEKAKQLIRTKIEEYLARAEMLKEHIQTKEKRPKKVVGADGSVNVTNGDKKYVCSNRLIVARQTSITLVQENRWRR